MASQTSHVKTKLWKLKLWHISERGWLDISKQGLLGSDKFHKLEFCDNCILDKQNRVKFGSDMHHSGKSFEHVHSNL